VFFWARVVYLPVYLIGITYVRSAVWGVGIFGLALMARGTAYCVTGLTRLAASFARALA
jgi:hypothetical protein